MSSRKCSKNLEPWVPEDNALKAITSEVIEHDHFNDTTMVHVRSIATETDLPPAQKILKTQGTQTECLDGISCTYDTHAQNVLSTMVLKNGHDQKVFVEDNSKSVLSRSTSLLPESYSDGKCRDKENCKLPRPSAEPKQIPKVKLFDCSYCEKAFTSYAFLVKHEKYHVENDVQMKVCDDLDETASKDYIFSDPNAEQKTDQDSQSLNDATKQNTVFSALIDTPPSSEVDSISFSQVCFQCGKNFTSSDEFDTHLQEHLKENFCKPCQKSYKNMKQFLKHIGSFHLTRRHTCYVCNRKYLLKSSVRKHLKHFHKVDNKEEAEKGSYSYKCGSCKAIFKLSDKLVEHHEVTNHEGTEYQCHECGKLCTQRSIIQQHITQEHNLDPKSTSSNLPNSTYERPSRLRECRVKKKSNSDSVPADEEGKSTKRYWCHKCNISYSWFNDIVKHRVKKKCCMDKPQVKMNGSRKQYICRYDDKVFDDKKLFAKHYIRHFKSRKIVPPPFNCDQCTETFPTLEALESHFVDHLEEKNKEASKSCPNAFSCEICGKCFGSTRNCRRHFRRCHAKKKQDITTTVNFYCDICSKGFYHRTNLASHRKVHLLQDNSFIEKKAQQVTETTTNTAAEPQTNQQQPAEINAKGNGMNKKFKCSKCQRQFFNQECLSRHKKLFNHGEVLDLRSSHVPKTEVVAPPKSRTKVLYNCALCKRSFKYYNVFYKHRAAHKGERVRECKICGKDFKTKTLSSHTCLSCKNLSQKKIKDLYTCKVCGKAFLGSRSLKSHMKAHNTGNFDCNSCGIAFSSEERLKKHMKNHKSEVNNLKNFKHGKGKLHECSKCERLYAGRKNLVRHRKICLKLENNQTRSSPAYIVSSKNCVKKEDQKKSDKKFPVFSCQFCQKTFSLFSELYNHCISMHEEKRPCCKCDKLMSSSASMKRHLAEKHTQDHTFYCHFCSEEFYNLNALLNHITQVPGVKKHKCSECGQTYSLCHTLMDHMKVHAKT